MLSCKEFLKIGFLLLEYVSNCCFWVLKYYPRTLIKLFILLSFHGFFLEFSVWSIILIAFQSEYFYFLSLTLALFLAPLAPKFVCCMSGAPSMEQSQQPPPRMCVPTCLCVLVLCLSVCICWGQRSMSGVIFSCFPCVFWDKVYCWSWNSLIWLDYQSDYTCMLPCPA